MRSSSRCPDVFEHDESCSCLADSGCDDSVCASLSVSHASLVDKRLHLPDGLSTNCDWCVGSCVHLYQLGLLPGDLEPCPCWCGLQQTGLVLHPAVIVWQERQVTSEVEVVWLRPECPLYTVVPTCCSGLRDPVDDQEEEKWWKKAPLPNSSLHLKTFRQLAIVGNSAAHVLKGAPDEGDYLLGDSIVSQ